jgi:very-short-patch-repair endonuclease
MREEGDTRDALVARIARQQHGVVSHAQLVACGFSTSAISRRVKRGWLYRVYRGVYAVGHPGISLHGRWMAATLTCGEEAAVSHRSAAELWQLLKPADAPVHIALPSAGARRQRAGVRLHRCPSLRLEHVTRLKGIQVTTPARTIDDLRRCVSPWELRRAIRQADVLGLAIEAHVESDRTRSDLERDFLRLCGRHRLPAPEVNVRVGPYLVDFLWPDRDLIVETDGYRYHRGRQAFEDDRARDLGLRARGFEVIRLSGRQVSDDPERVAEVLRMALAV